LFKGQAIKAVVLYGSEGDAGSIITAGWNGSQSHFSQGLNSNII